MEYGLRLGYANFGKEHLKLEVLILVVMEYGLRLWT